MRLQIAIALFLLAGCKANGTKQPEPSVVASCAGEQQCASCVNDLRSWMQALEDEGDQDALADQHGLELVTVAPTTVTTSLEGSGIIVVTKDTITFEGILMADPKGLMDRPEQWKIPELYDRLRQYWAMSCQSEITEKARITLQMDSKTPWLIVRDVVMTVEATGVDELLLAVKKKSRVAAPGPSSISAQIAEIEAENETGRALNKRPNPLESLFDSCESAREAFRKLSEDPPRFFTDALPDAIASCGCSVDMEAVKELRWWWAGRRDMKGLHRTGLSLTLADGKTPIRVENLADMPWSEAYKSLKPGESHYLELVGSKLVEGKARAVGQLCSAAVNDAGDRALDQARLAGVLGILSAEDGSVVDGTDFSSGLDDGAVYGGLLGDEVGVLAGGWNPAQVITGTPTIAGDLDKRIIRRLIRRRIPQIRKCYQSGLLSSPRLKGKITVTFTISKGTVQDATAKGFSRSISECVVNSIESIRFPRHDGLVTVRYPFSFRPD